MVIELGRYRIEYQQGYGIDNRSGWSVSWAGSFFCQFVPLRKAIGVLLRLVVKGRRKHRAMYNEGARG